VFAPTGQAEKEEAAPSKRANIAVTVEFLKI
jgi:hypothetical protein